MFFVREICAQSRGNARTWIFHRVRVEIEYSPAHSPTYIGRVSSKRLIDRGSLAARRRATIAKLLEMEIGFATLRDRTNEPQEWFNVAAVSRNFEKSNPGDCGPMTMLLRSSDYGYTLVRSFRGQRVRERIPIGEFSCTLFLTRYLASSFVSSPFRRHRSRSIHCFPLFLYLRLKERIRG